MGMFDTDWKSGPSSLAQYCRLPAKGTPTEVTRGDVAKSAKMQRTFEAGRCSFGSDLGGDGFCDPGAVCMARGKSRRGTKPVALCLRDVRTALWRCTDSLLEMYSLCEV